MKKIILFLAILSVGFLSSCSDDEDSNDTTPTPEDTFSAKINGVQKTFSVTNVDVLEYEGYTDVEITAQISGDPTNTFELNLTRDNGEYFFAQYAENDNYYQPDPLTNLTVSVSENTSTKLKGTFSGTMQETEHLLDPVTVTDGTFTIYY